MLRLQEQLSLLLLPSGWDGRRLPAPLGRLSLSGLDGERQSGIRGIGAGMTPQPEETICPFFPVIRESTGMLSC